MCTLLIIISFSTGIIKVSFHLIPLTHQCKHVPCTQTHARRIAVPLSLLQLTLMHVGMRSVHITAASVLGNMRQKQSGGGGRGECRICKPSGQTSADPVWRTAASGAADGERLVDLSAWRWSRKQMRPNFSHLESDLWLSGPYLEVKHGCWSH